MNKNYNELRFTDDFLFCKILENNIDLCKELLELILKVKISRIVFVEKQKTIEMTSDGKGIRMDVYLEDDAKKVYNIEMQTTVKKNLPKRSRYYQAMIDLNLIEKGSNYRELKQSYVIFICLKDIFGKGLPVYTFENQCKECKDLSLGDETTKIFINASGHSQDLSDEMRDFLNYLVGKSAESDFVKKIESEVQKAQTQERWRLEYMTLYERDMENREEGQIMQLYSLIQKGRISYEQAYEEVSENMTEEEFKERLAVCKENKN